MMLKFLRRVGESVSESDPKGTCRLLAPTPRKPPTIRCVIKLCSRLPSFLNEIQVYWSENRREFFAQKTEERGKGDEEQQISLTYGFGFAIVSGSFPFSHRTANKRRWNFPFKSLRNLCRSFNFGERNWSLHHNLLTIFLTYGFHLLLYFIMRFMCQ